MVESLSATRYYFWSASLWTHFDSKIDRNIESYRIIIFLFFNPRSFFLTNKQMGNHGSIIQCLTARFPALWIAQSNKDSFLPQYVYNLCKLYMQTPREAIKRYKPVEVQPYLIISIFLM